MRRGHQPPLGIKASKGPPLPGTQTIQVMFNIEARSICVSDVLHNKIDWLQYPLESALRRGAVDGRSR